MLEPPPVQGMKLLWNSLLISLGLLLPTSTSIVLAESSKPSESAASAASTSEVLPISGSAVTIRDGALLTPNSSDSEVKATVPITLISVEPATTAEASSTQRPDADVETIVIPDVTPASTPSTPTAETTDTPENAQTTTQAEPSKNPQASDSTEEASTQTDAPENTETTTAPCPTSEASAAEPSENPQASDSTNEAETTAQTDTPENAETTTADCSEDAADAKEPELSPEELARQQKLIEADQLFMSGQIAAAQQLYREAKDPFAAEAEANAQPEPMYDPAQLSPAGSVYWRQSTAGLEQKLETKTLIPLQFLVEQYPEFIPGHLRYAQALEDYGQEEEALQVLERAIALYPDEPELLKATITALGESEQWLEASLAARQFALLNFNHPEAEEFAALADENLERYKSDLRSELRGNAIANVITGALGYVLTGNLFGPISAVDTTVLMLRGESAVGESIANRVKKRAPLVEDEAVLEYVREIGNKLAIVAGRDDFEYEFNVITDENLNAFALPGGKVFVNAGAIMKTKSEAELAGLIAHELAHAVLSHGFQLVTEGNLIANVTQYFPFGGTAANLIVLNYSRDMERQADALGARILASAGYAADGMHNLMVTLDKEERDRPIFAWLSTHPDTQERISNIESLIERNGYNRYTYEGVARHQAMQERVEQLLREHKEREECKENKECEEPEEDSTETQEQEEQ